MSFPEIRAYDETHGDAPLPAARLSALISRLVREREQAIYDHIERMGEEAKRARRAPWRDGSEAQP